MIFIFNYFKINIITYYGFLIWIIINYLISQGYVNRGFAFYYELIANFYSAIGFFICCYTISDEQQFGQALLYLLLISGFIQWLMRQFIGIETYMSSTARAMLYSDL